MSQQELMAIAEAVARLMPRLARGLTSAEKDPADSLPLAQLRLCALLFEREKGLSEGSRPMSALSRELGVSHSALTQIADRLERASLVKRVAAASVSGATTRDRRVRCLQLTTRGEKMMRKRRDARVLRTLAVLEHLAVPQRETVRASLAAFLETGNRLVDACAAVHDGESGEAASEINGGGKNPAAAGRANGYCHESASGKRAKSTASPN